MFTFITEDVRDTEPETEGSGATGETMDPSIEPEGETLFLPV